MLEPGAHVPHFTVTGVDGRPVAYRDVWQKEHLLLLSLDDPSSPYASAVAAGLRDVLPHETRLVVTTDAIPGVPRPGLLVADRWGEVIAVRGANRVAELPSPGDVLEWVQFVQSKCPECEGEWK